MEERRADPRRQWRRLLVTHVRLLNPSRVRHVLAARVGRCRHFILFLPLYRRCEENLWWVHTEARGRQQRRAKCPGEGRAWGPPEGHTQQGECVSVCVGAVGEKRPREAVRYRLLHVLVLSWRAEAASGKKAKPDLPFGKLGWMRWTRQTEEGRGRDG